MQSKPTPTKQPAIATLTQNGLLLAEFPIKVVIVIMTIAIYYKELTNYFLQE